ncbi:prefoldin subunit 1 [Microthyrium microscopicum]|uniref:Prefoldin subunit 1 n=1 Tax=Microthyrium microscopicum TaxID=703497 RepID=A0A6A6U9I2_9PEZI|nr:prefoldin subunit 1 [Microthyrium microscopicum]
MAIPNEALRKVLMEIEQKSIQSSQQIQLVKAQIAAKKRESRILQLTASEVGVLPSGTAVYEGVGKMFIQTPPSDVMLRLEKEGSDLKNDVTNLEKKLHYLETTYTNSRNSFEQILTRAGGSV